jgi:hypothetical protein
MWIWIRLFTSMGIQIKIQGAKPMQIRIQILVSLCLQKRWLLTVTDPDPGSESSRFTNSDPGSRSKKAPMQIRIQIRVRLCLQKRLIFDS